MNRWITLLVLTGIVCVYVVYHQTSIQTKDAVEREFDYGVDHEVQTQKNDQDACAQAPDAYSYYYGLEGFEIDYEKAIECNDVSDSTYY